MTQLRDALATPDGALAAVSTATVSGIDAGGTVSVDFGEGRVVDECPVLASYTPGTGDVVQVMRRDASSWLVLGEVRTSNPTTVAVGTSLSFPFNVSPALAVAANPLIKSATSIRSWRENDGWYKSEAYQGAYSTRWGYHRGLYFYGSTAFDALDGQTCTGLTLHLSRTGSGGSGGAEPVYIAPHVHASQPAGAPYFIGSARKYTGPAWGDTVDLALPVSWGQGLIDGSIKGFGHLYLGTSDYAIFEPLSADAFSGRLTIEWS